MAEIKITKDNFATEVLQSDKPVLLDFWATWCGPCQMIAPTLKEIAEEYPQYKVGKVNVEEEEELAVKFGIESIPTLVVIKDGKIVNFSVGVKMKNSILDMLK